MRTTAYLLIEPTFNYSGDRITGAKVTGVRQRKPSTLDNEARALQVWIEIPDGFFDPPQAFINVIEDSDDEAPAGVVYDTPESAGAKVARAMEIAREAEGVFSSGDQS